VSGDYSHRRRVAAALRPSRGRVARRNRALARRRIGYWRSPYMQAPRAISAGIGRAITVKLRMRACSSADEVDAAQRDVQGRPDWFTLAYFHTPDARRTEITRAGFAGTRTVAIDAWQRPPTSTTTSRTPPGARRSCARWSGWSLSQHPRSKPHTS
jgi:hypothetical protein